MSNFLLGKMEPQTIIMLVLLAIMVVVLIVLPMFTNKRRNKAINDLHSSLRPGDVIKTVGGIVGTIVEIKEISPVDKEMVVETGVGNNKATMVFDVQAVYQVLSKVDAPATPAPQPFEENKTEQPVAEKAEEKTEETVVPAQTVPEESKEEPKPAEEQKAEEAATVEEQPAEAPARKPRSTGSGKRTSAKK